MTLEEREQNYQALFDSMKALIDGENDWTANMANVSALLYHHLENVNWVGFYLMREGELVLGPFQGKPACIRIEVGSGVCGTAAKEKKSYVVEDVNKFNGHIACDPESNSEIVIPLFYDDEIIGVLDIDSPVKNNFDELDQKYLEKMTERLVKASNIETI